MAIPHASAGEVIDVRPLGSTLTAQKTTTLAKTNRLELIRLVLPQGKKIDTHVAPDEIVLQCIEGQVEFNAKGRTCELIPGSLLYLNPSEPHSLHALQNSSLLLTIILAKAR